MKRVYPLGVFGEIASQEAFAGHAEALAASSDSIPEGERGAVASYLRAGTVILALMADSEDVLGSKFHVVGGPGILSDGVYFWRRDTAEYVENYGVALPDDFLEHGRALGWRSTELTREQVIEVDDYFVWRRSQRA